MQGGRDKLGWIRQLVRYTETHPIYIADNASSVVEVLQDGSIQKTVFPSLKPNRREDALLLQQWLADMMAQLTANAPQVSSNQVITAHSLFMYCTSFTCSAAHPCTEADCAYAGSLSDMPPTLLFLPCAAVVLAIVCFVFANIMSHFASHLCHDCVFCKQ